MKNFGMDELEQYMARKGRPRHGALILGSARASRAVRGAPPRTLPSLYPFDDEELPRAAETPPRFKINGTNGAIRIHGAREHNLKNIDVKIPRDQMVVITGLSGSGKSTLAFDILFAEGQRRFLDSMSPYARQFVEQLEKPDVDAVEGDLRKSDRQIFMKLSYAFQR